MTHVFLSSGLNQNDLFDFLLNQTSNQIEQKIDHLEKNGQCKWDI